MLLKEGMKTKRTIILRQKKGFEIARKRNRQFLGKDSSLGAHNCFDVILLGLTMFVKYVITSGYFWHSWIMHWLSIGRLLV